MRQEKYSRRALLKTLGVGAGMLPLIHAERTTADTPSGFPKRLISIMRTGGVRYEAFFPQETGSDFTVLPTIAPLARFKSKMLLPLGLDYSQLTEAGGNPNDSWGHSSHPSVLTGNVIMSTNPNAVALKFPANGPSIDQIISERIGKTRVPLLNVGIGEGSQEAPTSWRSAGVKNTPIIDAVKVWTTLFQGPNLQAGQIDPRINRRKSVLDSVHDQLGRFGQRLGTDDRQKIEAHLTSIRALEAQLQAQSTPLMCAEPPMQPSGVPAPTDLPAVSKLMCSLIAAAIQCDVTRVVTFDMTHTGGAFKFPWLPLVNPAGDYHAIQHAGGSMDDVTGKGVPVTPEQKANKLMADTWFYQTIADNLVRPLDTMMEGTGKVLDNCVVVLNNDTIGNHGTWGLPYVMLGSCGGFFKTGRQVRLGNWAPNLPTGTGEYWRKHGGVPHNKLLATLCQAMDVNVTQVGPDKYAGDITTALRT